MHENTFPSASVHILFSLLFFRAFPCVFVRVCMQCTQSSRPSALVLVRVRQSEAFRGRKLSKPTADPLHFFRKASAINVASHSSIFPASVLVWNNATDCSPCVALLAVFLYFRRIFSRWIAPLEANRSAWHASVRPKQKKRVTMFEHYFIYGQLFSVFHSFGWGYEYLRRTHAQSLVRQRTHRPPRSATWLSPQP